jgi:hypothetical protein
MVARAFADSVRDFGLCDDEVARAEIYADVLAVAKRWVVIAQ